jgi:hypothetical protein
MRRTLAVAAALAASALAGGCGGTAGDLLSLTVGGGLAGAPRTVVVSGDGRGSCDRGQLKPLPSGRVIDARAIERDAADLAKRAAEYPPRPGARSYTLKTKDGVVRWSEGSPRLPAVLPRAQLLALQLDRELCPAR